MRELESRLSVRELREWQMLYVDEPFGGVRDDLNTANIVRAVYAAAGGKVKFEDCILRFGGTSTDASPEQKQQVKEWMAEHGVLSRG